MGRRDDGGRKEHGPRSCLLGRWGRQRRLESVLRGTTGRRAAKNPGFEALRRDDGTTQGVRDAQNRALEGTTGRWGLETRRKDGFSCAKNLGSGVLCVGRRDDGLRPSSRYYISRTAAAIPLLLLLPSTCEARRALCVSACVRCCQNGVFDEHTAAQSACQFVHSVLRYLIFSSSHVLLAHISPISVCSGTSCLVSFSLSSDVSVIISSYVDPTVTL
jgi:hypothetical protein